MATGALIVVRIMDQWSGVRCCSSVLTCYFFSSGRNKVTDEASVETGRNMKSSREVLF